MLFKKRNNEVKQEMTLNEMLKWDSVLQRFSFSDLTRIFQKLNVYEWAEELGKPPESLKTNPLECKELSYICKYIKQRCGNKALLRYYHKTEFGETDQEFDDWWESTHLFDDPFDEVPKRIGEYHTDSKRNYGCLFINCFLSFILGLICGAVLKMF